MLKSVFYKLHWTAQNFMIQPKTSVWENVSQNAHLKHSYLILSLALLYKQKNKDFSKIFFTKLLNASEV